MKPRLGDVFLYGAESLFIIGSNDVVYRLSFQYTFELADAGKELDFWNFDDDDTKWVFNLFDILGEALGGKYGV